MKFWPAQSTRGSTSLGDDERSGRLKTATTDDNITQVHQMVPDGYRIKDRELAKATRISKEPVCHILHQEKTDHCVRCLYPPEQNAFE